MRAASMSTRAAAKRAREAGDVPAAKRQKKAAPAAKAKAKAEAKSKAATAKKHGEGEGRWMIKSEPEAYSLDDLERDGTEPWDGIRNYAARNNVRDKMKVGDLAVFYHSSCKVPGAVGVARVSSEPRPEPEQFDPKAKYYDPASKRDDPRWFVRDMTFQSRFARKVSLEQLKSERGPGQAFENLCNFKLPRLSVAPLTAAEFDRIVELGGSAGGGKAAAAAK